MKSVDLLIKGKRIYLENEIIEGNIAVKDGKVVGIYSKDINLEAENEINAGNNLVMPGLVDPHVHLRDPGRPERETFKTGTMAAAAGGVTTICEHPISIPPPHSPEIIKNRHEVAKDKAVVDYALFGAAGGDFLEDIKPASEEGIVAFKTFLHEAPPGRDDEFEGLTMENDGQILMGFKEISNTGKICAIHAENNEIVQYFISKFREEGKTDSIHHAKSRPRISEYETVSKMIHFAEETGARIQIAHISLPETVDLIWEAKNRGVEVYAETCPHYLFLHEEHLKEYGPYAKCNPPVRKKEDTEKMLKRVREGKIDFIGSDHGPFLPEEKEKGKENIFDSPAGMPNIEATLPMMYTLVKENKLSLNKMIEMIVENPAKTYGLYPQKGAIKVGSDADFVILETDKEYEYKIENLLTKARDLAKVYNGWQVYGNIRKTIVRGRTIYEDGKVDESDAGWGEFIKPRE